VIDYVGGLNDLRDGVLKAIGDPAARFTEDKLRLLRAVRFAARFGFSMDGATNQALKAMADQIRVVAAERLAQELRKMLVDVSRSTAMQMMMDTGLMSAVLPPVVAMRGIFQGKPIQPEGDLWDHTKLVLDLLPESPSFPLAFAALLHDVGKPESRSTHNGRASFHNHEQVGKSIAETLCRQLKLSNQERERVVWLVLMHQYLGEATKLRESKLKKALAMPGIEELLALHRADALASTGDASHVDYCEYYLKNEPSGPINPPPLLGGHDLGRHGIKHGPLFKIYLEAAYEAQLEMLVHNKSEALEWLDRKIADGELPS